MGLQKTTFPTHDVLVMPIHHDLIEEYLGQGWEVEPNRSHHGRYNVLASLRVPKKRKG